MTGTPIVCTGDCNDNHAIEINELVLGVGIALEANPLTACPAFDHDGDERVTLPELVRAVDFALHSCP
ncbi:MAG: hypothetical protein A3J75_05420 [Acidobacteria bacterium RBG_16_68_9]|nr:MAG: hypothetical protein A3J75_05420 [Acidobacteria bacterium RBG_16_68_9]